MREPTGGWAEQPRAMIQALAVEHKMIDAVRDSITAGPQGTQYACHCGASFDAMTTLAIHQIEEWHS